MIVLDTNVISESLRPGRSAVVTEWLDSHAGECFTTSLTQAEILLGIEILPLGRRRTGLYSLVERIFAEDFHGRVLPFDGVSARAYAEIIAHKQRIGRPMSDMDCMIAAIARVHGASLATRNIKDFERCGVRLINPWIHSLQ